jgi:hypothetical protein
MDLIRGTLVCDGSSDQMLIPILHWLFEQNGLEAVEIVRPRLGGGRNPPRTLAERVMILRQSRRLSVAGPSKGPDRDGHSDLHSAKLAEARTHLQPTHL